MIQTRMLVVTLAIVALGCQRRVTNDESRRRDEFVRALTEREGLRRVQRVSDRSDAKFEWGMSNVEYNPKDDYRGEPLRWIGQRVVIRLRSHGDKPMRLDVIGWVNRKALRTTPIVSGYIDGQRLSTMLPDENGTFWVGGIVPREMLKDADWVVLDVDLSSVAFHWGEPPELKVALISSLEWTEVDAR